MSIFKKTKKNTEDNVSKETKSVDTKKVISKKDLTWVIKKPRITEKGAILAGEKNVYTFNLHQDANKKEVAEAIEIIYKVKPTKIRISAIKPKTVRRKGGLGKKSGGKKAYVYLKKGDKIEFV
jgi:large subunit ribosomal protein L23